MGPFPLSPPLDKPLDGMNLSLIDLPPTPCVRIKNASTRTKMVVVFVRSRTQSTQRGRSLATVTHWLLTGITTRGTGVDLRYQMDV